MVAQAVRDHVGETLTGQISGFRLQIDGVRCANLKSELSPLKFSQAPGKLARETRASAILQLCAYADLLTTLQGSLLTTLQGSRPERMGVAAPGRPFSYQSFRVDEFFAYYSLVIVASRRV
jgi:uncharacterized protein